MGIPSNINITAPEEHTYDMVVSNGDGAHSEKCSGCGDTKESVSCTLALTATAEGNVISVRGSCAACGYGAELGKVTVNLPKLIYRELDGAVFAATTLTEWLNVSVAVDAAYAAQTVLVYGNDPKPLTMADLTSSQNLAVGEHKLTVGIMIKVGTFVECPLTFTVDPIPLSGTSTFGSDEGKKLGEVEVTYPEGWPKDVTFTLTWEAGDDAQVVRGMRYACTVTADNYGTVSGSVTIPLEGSAKLEIVDNSKRFDDVPITGWKAEAAAFASSHELFKGTAPGRFSPDDPMSRGMLAVVLHNLENNPEQALTGAFADVSTGQWYAEGVAWAAAQGLVSGYGNGQFGPGDNITKEQLAVMLWRYVGSPAATERELHFADADKASGWALEALRWAAENGVINDRGGTLEPTGQVTRAETAQMLKNFMERR